MVSSRSPVDRLAESFFRVIRNFIRGNIYIHIFLDKNATEVIKDGCLEPRTNHLYVNTKIHKE
jgi:hypothetical protein